MKRAYVYIILGPTFGVLGSLLSEMMKSGVSAALRDPAEGAFLAFVFGFLVSLPALLVDASLARVIPIVVRAPFIAASGTAIAFACLAIAGGRLPSLQHFTIIGIIAAGAMGACSLLSNDFSKS